MNQNSTSIPGSSLLPSGTDTITTVHLVVLALVALLVIAGIVWGIRLKHRRTVAERELREHNQIVEAAAPPPSDATPPPAPRSPQPMEAPAAASATVAPTIAPPPPAPAPAAVAATPPAPPLPDAAAAREAASLPVTQLKGLGPKVAAQLADLGITTVGQIAALSDSDAQALDARLGAFTGRMARDRWVEQARLLAAGDRAGFEATFGRL